MYKDFKNHFCNKISIIKSIPIISNVMMFIQIWLAEITSKIFRVKD